MDSPGLNGLPADTEAEEALLGSMIRDSSQIAEVSEMIEAKDYSLSPHRLIHRAIVSMWESGQQVDQVTLNEKLDAAGLLSSVGPEKVLDLYQSAPSPSEATSYAQIVREKSARRRLIKQAKEASEGATEAFDLSSVIEDTQQEMARVREMLSEGNGTLSPREAGRIIDRIEELRDEDGVVGYETGLVDLDRQLQGLQGGEYVLIAGRPSMGKSSLMRNITTSLAVDQGCPTAFFSIEMTGQSILQLFLCSWADVPGYKVRGGNVTDEEIQRLREAKRERSDAPIVIDDTSSASVMDLRARVEKLKRKHDIGAVVVDYLQLMSGPGAERREREVAEISRQLATLANSEEILVIAGSQLNRKVQNREEPRPKLSDLRESGALEQDADKVLLLYRPPYYGRGEDESEAEIIVAKNRQGPTGSVEVRWDSEYMRFENLANDFQGVP